MKKQAAWPVFSLDAPYSFHKFKNSMTTINDYKNTSTLTQWLRWTLIGCFTMGIVLILCDIHELWVLTQIQNDYYSTEEEASAVLDRVEMRQIIASIFWSLFYFSSVVLTCVWLYRSKYNAQQAGAHDMRFTPGWTVGWHFIPLANLWKPYQAMKELWQVSAAPHSWKVQNRPALLPCWWTLWLLFGIISQAEMKTYMRAETLDQYIISSKIAILSDLLWLPLCLIFLQLVTQIHRLQQRNFPDLQNIPAHESAFTGDAI